MKFMDVILNGLSTSAEEELQSLCCMMGKTISLDVASWLLMFGDSFGAREQPILHRHYLFDVWFDTFNSDAFKKSIYFLK